MLNDFDTIKIQLKELSEVLNTFKSEAVQLRIIDIIFGQNSTNDSEQELEDELIKFEHKGRPAKNIKSKRRKTMTKTGGNKSKSSSKGGPKAAVEELISEGFFKNPKTISDVISQCKTMKARIFKTSDISPTLGRLIREKKLSREKNSDGQFEYKQ